MQAPLKKFETSGNSSDSPILNKLLQNYIKINQFQRKLSVKCLGDGVNSRQLKELLEKKMTFRDTSFKFLENMKS